MMFKYDGLAVDGDGEYFAVFRNENTKEHILLDNNGVAYWFNENMDYQFRHDELAQAMADLKAKTRT